ncbi:MBL fold metallo-hydrolase [Effusibacillus consociatus]|uniref:MBL fold metallo-hydrolase n=1 Tax=Effusibacillus consociatus TaxID=1117041 RepID=A0ABV9PZS6_9BACL
MNIQQISENLYRIPIPVPFPMKYIYCYLFKGKEGWEMIDAGFNYPAAQEAWWEVFSYLELNPKNIRVIYITHFHPDHFGLAGWMQQVTGAPVYIGMEDYQMVTRVWDPQSIQAKRIGEMCTQNGVSAVLSEQIVEHMEKLNKHVLPMPELTPLTDQEVLLGNEYWQVIHTPGHSDGHICFYQSKKRVLIAADHILDKITPNISLWPGCRSNPLQDYLDSLQKIKLLDVEQVLPGHGRIITHLSDRVDEILQHHEQRLDKMYSLAKEGRTAYQIADVVFSHKELTPHQWRFAMAETLAHLEFLVANGKLAKIEDEKIVYADSGKEEFVYLRNP